MKKISDHITYKEAVHSNTALRLNIKNIPNNKDVSNNAEMFSYIKTNLNFDQLIWEFGDSTNPNWIHVSYVSDDLNRNKILIAEKINGRTSYRSYEQETL